MKCDGRLIYEDKKTAMRTLRELRPLRGYNCKMSVQHCIRCHKYHIIDNPILQRRLRPIY